MSFSSAMFSFVFITTVLSCMTVCVESIRPNLILVVADDVGYGDFFHTGHPTQERNEIDQMANEGMRFTHFMAAARSCSPNRAAMLTGRYPAKLGLYGKYPVFLPQLSTGLPTEEVTLAEALRELGYVTGMVGKWHLGINQHNNTDGVHLPSNHGFEYVGLNLPMTHVSTCHQPTHLPLEVVSQMCFLYNGSTIIEQPYNPSTLSPRMVDDAKHFIRKNKDRNFFFYMSSPQPHDPAFCSEKFCGKSKRGRYGDAVNELAWTVGEIMAEVKRNSLERNTLVLFVNDHGGGQHGCQPHNSRGAFHGSGGTCWEGDIRGTAIAWWPKRISKGSVNSAIVSSMDIYPTFLKLARRKYGKMTRGLDIDGQIISSLLQNEEGNEDRFLVHYCSSHVFAARLNQFKLHFKTLDMDHDKTKRENQICQDVQLLVAAINCDGEFVTSHDPPLLYNVDEDPAESFPLPLEEYEEIVTEIRRRLQEHKDSFTLQQPGLLDDEVHTELTPCCNPPKCTCNFKK